MSCNTLIKRTVLFLGLIASAGIIAPTTAFAEAYEITSSNDDYQNWLRGVYSDGVERGIDKRLLVDALDGLTPLERVVTLDRKQPESKLTIDEYLERVLPYSRIQEAQLRYDENSEVLERIGKQYGVQPEYIVALWGIESNFGSNMGGFSVIEALATLAFDGRRSDYFRGELLNALQIIDEGHITLEDMNGSWAGAMGQCQFMPTSFIRYAVDYNEDGHKDIWNTNEDVFASIANYLSSEGWNPSRGWGSREEPRDNFDVILKWNRSRYFATAVGQLAYQVKP